MSVLRWAKSTTSPAATAGSFLFTISPTRSVCVEDLELELFQIESSAVATDIKARQTSSERRRLTVPSSTSLLRASVEFNLHWSAPQPTAFQHPIQLSRFKLTLIHRPLEGSRGRFLGAAYCCLSSEVHCENT